MKPPPTKKKVIRRPLIDGSMIFFIALAVVAAALVYLLKGHGALGHALGHAWGLMIGVAPLIALGMMLGIAMLLTPFLNNAAAVLMLGPVAGVVAKTLGYNPDPFLMAVALGCACDFLTPIGHQNNLLVMGPGGYRFGDYWRLGLPLSIIVILVAVPLLLVVWPV